MISDFEVSKYNDNPNYNPEEKLRELREEIEKLRYELQNTVIHKGYLCNQEKTYTISTKLDTLIVQFMRIKEQLDGK